MKIASAPSLPENRSPGRRLQFVLVAVLSFAAPAGASASADYRLIPCTLDGGGGRQTSADYALDGSLADGGAWMASADYALAAGFPAQLNNSPLVTVTEVDWPLEPGTSLRLDQAQLLTSALDPDGDTLELAGVEATSTQGGQIAWAGGWITYLPPAGWSGPDSFAFTVRDAGGDVATGWVLLSVGGEVDLPKVNLVAVLPLGGDAVLVRFEGVVGRVYRVEATSSLKPPVHWTDLGNAQAAANGLLEVTDPEAGPLLQRFFRTHQP